MKNISYVRSMLLLLVMLCVCFSAQSQTTYNFDAGAVISQPPGSIWNTQANIVIGGINYKLTSCCNGGFSNSPDQGNGNSASLQKTGSGGDTFVLERADGQPFQFYGFFVAQESINSYVGAFPGIPPFYEITYVKTVGAPEIEVDNTPVSGGTFTTGGKTYTKNLTVTQVSILFKANNRYWIDDIRVGVVSGTEVAPTVSTSAAGSITSNSAVLGGNVTADGGAAVTERGIVWSMAANPTTANNKVAIGSGTGSFSNTVGALPFSATINYRAYAINSEGTSYGTNLSFSTLAPTIVVNPVTVPGATVGVPYSQSFTGSGGTAPYTSALTSGTLPVGVSLNPATGVLSGTPSSAGTFNFIIRSTDASAAPGPFSGSRAYTLVVAPPVTVIAPATLPNGTVAAAYSQTITASGGIAPYNYTITAGALPAGLTLSSGGLISGTPTAGGTFNFTVTAAGSSTGTGAPHTGSRAYALVVAPPTISLPATSLANGNVGTAYSQALNPASGGTSPYSYGITAGALPPGISLSSGGVLSGTPTTNGTFNFAVAATDASSGSGPYSSAPRGYTLMVNNPIVISPATLPDPVYAQSYSQGLSTTGGTAPYSYSILAGALPVGMSFSSAGVLSGVPRSDGNFSLTVKATDNLGFSVSKVYTFSIAAPVIAIDPATLPDPVIGVAYTQSLSSSGGIAPYSYSLVSGALPIGMSFSSAGVLSGTPSLAGTFTFVVRSTDDASANNSKAYTLNIAVPALVISPPLLPSATAGTAYNQNITTSGSISPYSYSLVSGALPVGMSFSSAGVFSGTPTVKGLYSFTVRSTDASSGAYTADKIYSLNVLGKTQHISIAATATLNYGDADYDPLASSDSGLPVSYTSSDPAVATIVAGKVHILAAGQVTIFANQAGDASFNAASQQQQVITINKAQLSYVANTATKVYGAANPALSGTVTGFKYADNLAGATTGTASFSTTATTASGVGSYAVNGSGLTAANYTFVQAAANASALTVTPKTLIITADNKEKFAGTANPVFTATYNGFITGETQTVLTAQPVFATTAVSGSPVGTYDINVSGAAAANYAISYVKGTLTIKPGAPTDISLASVTLYENRPAGTNAGTLNSVSADPSATFTYTLVAGTGDTDNALFAISTNQLNTAANLNFEQKAVYSVRVRSTTQYGLSFEKVLSVAIADVNEAPTLAAIVNLPICYTTNLQTVALSGISAGPESGQTVILSLNSNNSALFESLAVSNSGSTGAVTYRVKSGASGTATVTVTAKDNGGTANGGTDTFNQTFIVTVNPLPVLVISSDKGSIVSRGEVALLTATGAANYAWTGSNGIISGANSAVLTVRPTTTTTYTLNGTNASGCSQVQTFTVTVVDDLTKIKSTNILTPNNDGYNDKWIVENIDVYPDNEVKVFDRAGRIVYTKKGYDNSWDGNMNGAPLAEGTYYYVIDFGTMKAKLRGYITLIRESK